MTVLLFRTSMLPSKKKFLSDINETGIPVLYEEIPYCEPCGLYECLRSPCSFMFESVKGPENIARYSFIGFDPALVFKAKDSVVEVETGNRKTIFNQKPQLVLKNLISVYPQKANDMLPPFQGGLAGMFSYDYAQYFEKLPHNAADDLDIPDAHFMLVDKLVAFDRLLEKCWIIICPGVKKIKVNNDPEVATDWAVEYEKAEVQMLEIKSRLSNSNYAGNAANHKTGKQTEIVYEMKKTEYMDIVRRAKEYIAAGDIFQANLSQRVSACIDGRDIWKLYRILRSINPSPFAGFIDFAGYQILSSSPERLVRVRKRIIETRPIAGTRPRGTNSREDEQMRADLLLNEKERAEHIMLIDLERNDLGRVSEYGSVCVDEMMITEDYSHVMHIVSNIRGILAPGKDCFDAVRATFPGGTITGVPKVRCMEIIDELEPVRRGPYTGSFGYIGFSGDMDLNIIIRTFVIKGERAYVQAGAGIVADSDPEREYYETLNKAEALLRTLETV